MLFATGTAGFFLPVSLNVLLLMLGHMAHGQRPNIVFILADDLAWNDVSFHGSQQIPTPNIDEIAATGIKLNNYYLQPVCSPTRATLLSGRHVIHTGIYNPLGGNGRLNRSFTLIPTYMKMLGYSAHMVGKWHLGHNELAYLPTYRGFDTHFGCWTGAHDYWTHISYDGSYDMAQGDRTAFESNNTFSTNVFAAKAVDIIRTSTPGQPFFLYVAFTNVHTPLQAPQNAVDRCANSTGNDYQRRMVCALGLNLDEGVGNITAALKAKGIYDNTLLVFSTDNGGPTNYSSGGGFPDLTFASNYPLRGGKDTLWEGGMRGVGIIRGPGLSQQLVGKESNSLIHVSDWLRTFTTVASGQPGWLDKNLPAGEPPFLLGDGQDIWPSLSSGQSVRTEFLYECQPLNDTSIHGNALRVGDWKIVWIGKVNLANNLKQRAWPIPPGQDPTKVKYTLLCDPSQQPIGDVSQQCTNGFCLFNLTADPCEYKDVSSSFPDVLGRLIRRLADYQSTAVPVLNPSQCGCAPLMSGAVRPCDAPDFAGVRDRIAFASVANPNGLRWLALILCAIFVKGA